MKDKVPKNSEHHSENLSSRALLKGIIHGIFLYDLLSTELFLSCCYTTTTPQNTAPRHAASYFSQTNNQALGIIITNQAC